ncbi:MAG TPA: LytTR family DNA-binding domain-containing protein [Bacteroidia bacterium]|nr:LytTR family DNA-binding domain-containing protein [Bacteroidia bacterium]
MLKAIIIDDEANGIKYLQHLISKNCPTVEIIASETIPEQAVLLIEKLKPDLVFLDIEMPTLNGFELLEQIKHLSFHVIFTTAYNSYAIKAFKYNTIDYLLKPVVADELVAAILKLDLIVKNKKSNLSIGDLLEKIDNLSSGKKLAINSLNEIIYVELGNIIRLESDASYTHIFLVGNKKITSPKLLKDYENILNPNFFRPHKSFIINLDYVEKYIKAEGGYIIMIDNVQIPVSREKRQTLINILAAR